MDFGTVLFFLAVNAHFRALIYLQDKDTSGTLATYQNVSKSDIMFLKLSLLGKFQNFLEETDLFGLFLIALTFFTQISDSGYHYTQHGTAEFFQLVSYLSISTSVVPQQDVAVP